MQWSYIAFVKKSISLHSLLYKKTESIFYLNHSSLSLNHHPPFLPSFGINMSYLNSKDVPFSSLYRLYIHQSFLLLFLFYYRLFTSLHIFPIIFLLYISPMIIYVSPHSTHTFPNVSSHQYLPLNLTMSYLLYRSY